MSRLKEKIRAKLHQREDGCPYPETVTSRRRTASSGTSERSINRSSIHGAPELGSCVPSSADSRYSLPSNRHHPSGSVNGAAEQLQGSALAAVAAAAAAATMPHSRRGSAPTGGFTGPMYFDFTGLQGRGTVPGDPFTAVRHTLCKHAQMLNQLGDFVMNTRSAIQTLCSANSASLQLALATLGSTWSDYNGARNDGQINSLSLQLAGEVAETLEASNQQSARHADEVISLLNDLRVDLQTTGGFFSLRDEAYDMVSNETVRQIIAHMVSTDAIWPTDVTSEQRQSVATFVTADTRLRNQLNSILPTLMARTGNATGRCVHLLTSMAMMMLQSKSAIEKPACALIDQCQIARISIPAAIGALQVPQVAVLEQAQQVVMGKIPSFNCDGKVDDSPTGPQAKKDPGAGPPNMRVFDRA